MKSIIGKCTRRRIEQLFSCSDHLYKRAFIKNFPNENSEIQRITKLMLDTGGEGEGLKHRILTFLSNSGLWPLNLTFADNLFHFSNGDDFERSKSGAPLSPHQP